MRGVTRILVGVLLLFAATTYTEAQTAQGVVTGTVFDSTGAAVPKAVVTLTNVGTSISQTVPSGSDGAYRFSLVPPGTYKLDVKASGFTEKQVTEIRVDPSETVPVNVSLDVASAATTVEVEASASLVQTATSDLSTTVNSRTIESIPLLTRNVFNLAFAAPAVTQGMNFMAASGGARESGTTNMLNGSDNNDNFSEGGFNVQPPLESVSEFTVLTNNMSAQYGHASGALVSAIQKSGTNQFHGALYEFNRNTDFNASTFFDNRAGNPNPKYIRNQYGGEIDGPVIKDKTFFMFTYDRIDLHQGTTINQVVPTPTELSAITAAAGPKAKAYLQQYQPLTSTAPCPAEAVNAPDAVGHMGCVNLNDPILTGLNTYAGRIDHNFSSKDRLSFTANIVRSNNTDKWGGGYPTGATNIPGVDNEHYHNLSLVETHTFGANLVNELTIAHNRHYSVFQAGNGTSAGAQVQIDLANYDGITGENGNGWGFGPTEGALVQGFVQDRWQFQDGLAWTKGKHSLKFGGGMQYGILYRNWDLGSPGYYEFSNTMGPRPADVGALLPNGDITNIQTQTDSNFVNDFPYYSELSVDPRTGGAGNAYRHYIMKDTNVFVNDDWKLSRRLTVNLGLRWERYGAPTEANNIIAQFTNLNGYNPASIAAARVGPATSMWITPNHDFGPRVGFAWDMFGDSRTSLRAGYGISYDRLFDNIWSNGAWNPPFYGLVDHDATAGDTISYTLPPSIAGFALNSIPSPTNRVSVRTMDVHMKDSSVQNYYLGIERQFFRNYLVRVNYQGSMGRHLSQLMNLNRFDGSAYNANLSTANTRPNPLYTGFNYRANNLTSNYNSLVTEVQKRYSNGLQFQFSFTWSRLMDDGSDLFSGSTTTGQYSQPYYFLSNNQPQLEYGPGAFDHQKNFKAIFTYELPFLKNNHSFAGKAFGGWQVSGFYQGYSGHPINVYLSRGRYVGNALDPNGFKENLGGDYNLDGVNNDRPDFIGQSASAAYSGFSPADGIFVDNNLIGCGFPGAKSTNIQTCNNAYGVSKPNSLFINPPGYGVHYGTLGRDLFRGPWFNGLDASLMKNFAFTERVKLQLRFEALNLDNHPNFDGIQTNLNSANFGKAQILAGQGSDSYAPSRRLQLGARLTF